MLLLEDKVNVAWRDRPFNGRVHQAHLPQGLSCADIVARVPDIDTRRFLEQGVVCINGEPVPREMWPFVRPKSRNDIFVTLHMPIRGGGGGGKDVLRIVAAIALVAVTTAISGGAAAGLLGASFSAGTIGAQVLAGVVSIGGALLLGAFVKPPSSDDDPETEEGAPAALRGNELKRGGSVPRVVGTHRAFPPFLSQPLVDLDEYDEVVEAAYGFAGPHQLRDVKFGDVYADDIDPEHLQYQFYELIPGEGGIDENTQIMLQLNGAQDSTEFTDSSQYETTFTKFGDVFIDKVLRESWIGRAAGYFDQSDQASLLTAPARLGLQFGGVDWSIEFFIEFDDDVGLASTLYYICGQVEPGLAAPTAAQVAWYVYKDTNGRLNLVVSDGSSLFTVTTTTSIEAGTDGQKYHFVGERVGNVLRAHLDGVQEGGDVAFTGVVPSLAAAIVVGARRSSAVGSGAVGSGGSSWPGWLSGFRVVVGATGFPDGVSVPQVIYRPVEPNLITRYGKTMQPGIQLAEHRVANEEEEQGPRDKLSNQIQPTRSLPLAQSIVVRGRGFDEIWVTLNFQSGLSYFDDDFDRDWFNGIAFRIRIREVGSSVWRNLPEVHIHDRRTSPFSRMLVFRWDNEDELTDGVPNVSPPVRKGWKAAYTSVPTQNIDPIGIGGWEADELFYAGSGPTYLIGTEEDAGPPSSSGVRNVRLTAERAEFFLNNVVARGPLEIEIRRSQLYIANKLNYAAYDYELEPPDVDDGISDGGILDLFGYLTNSDGEHVIILKPSNAGDQVVISRASTVWNRPPLASWGTFAPLYVRIKGRNLDTLSVLASGLVADWDGSEWTGLNATSNPAPHYRDVLVGDLNDNAIPDTLVGDETLLEWRTRCTALGFTCNAVFNGDNVDRVLEIIASCGYARPRQSELWDVAQDRDFSAITPVQMFTPRNMRGFRWEKAFVRNRPDGLRVKYNDSTDNYVERTIIVPRAGVLDAQAGRLEEIRYEGLVTERSAVTKATYDQRQITDRFTFYYGEVDAEILVCRRGDLVIVQHDILDNVAGFSRVKDVTIVGDVVTAIVLDGSITPIQAFFEASPPFFVGTPKFFTENVGVAIRLKDGTTITFNAELSADGFTLTPAQLISGVGDLLERECLVTTGRILKVNRRLLVYDIAPRADLTAEVTFVDEAPSVWDFPADLPPVPPDIPAVRAYQQYVEVARQGNENAVNVYQQFADVVYTPDPGTVQMYHQFVEVVHSLEDAGPAEELLEMVASNTSTESASVTCPATVEAGDLLVMWDISNGAAPQPVDTVPSGFTRITTTAMVSASGNSRAVASYKIADGSEAGGAITGMALGGSGSSGKCLYVFRRTPTPIGTVVVQDMNEEVATGNPTAQVKNASGSSFPLVVLGFYSCFTANVDPRTFSPAKDGEISAQSIPAAFSRYLAFKVYNDSPADTTIDQDDDAPGLVKLMASCYIEITS